MTDDYVRGYRAGYRACERDLVAAARLLSLVLRSSGLRRILATIGRRSR